MTNNLIHIAKKLYFTACLGSRLLVFGLIFAGLSVTICTAASAATSNETDTLTGSILVSQAYDAIPAFINESEWKDYIVPQLRRAKAVIVVPELIKGGVILGGEKGKGVMLAKAPDGQWSYPIFYDFYSGSVGLQFGLEKSRHLMLVMTDKGFDSLFFDGFKLGGEINVAVGLVGGSGEIATTRNLGADIVSYSISQGVYGGINFEGTYVEADQDVIDAYYGGRNIAPRNVLNTGKYKNPQADKFRALISDLAR